MHTDEPDNTVEPAQPAGVAEPPPARPASRSTHPLGPLWQMVPLESRLGGRLYAAGVLAATTAVLAVAAVRLHPDGLYEGVHQQLGLPPCGFVQVTGLPCPTCGMTTAFAHAVRGEVGASIHSQAAGFVLALATFAVGVFSAVALVTGRRPSLNWYRIDPLRVVWAGCGLFVFAWGVKIVIWLLADGSASRMHN